VFVDGEWLMKDRIPLRVDETQILKEARQAAAVSTAVKRTIDTFRFQQLHSIRNTIILCLMTIKLPFAFITASIFFFFDIAVEIPSPCSFHVINDSELIKFVALWREKSVQRWKICEKLSK
jgi:hypothetical protein